MTEMNKQSPVTPSAPLHIAGLGVPLIDFITPQDKELVAGEETLALLQQAVTKQSAGYSGPEERERIAQIVTEGPRHLIQAREALAAFNHFWHDEQKYKKGQKETLEDPEAAQKVAEWFHAILVAARDINAAAAFMEQPERGLMIRHMGGTMCNKFHMTKAMMGDQLETHMLGALGDEDDSGNRKRVVDNLAASNTNFHEFWDVSLGNMAVSYIIPYDGDRIVLKAKIENLDVMLGPHQDHVAEFAREPKAGISPDMYFIEGSDYSANKFGPLTFTRFADEALNSGKPIVFSPPTDTKMILGDSETAIGARREMNKLIDSPQTGLLTMNEEEVVAMFTGEKYIAAKAPETEDGQPGIKPPITDHPQLQDALTSLTYRLRQKAESLPPGAVEPVAFVSAGPDGGFFVSQRGFQFVPCAPTKALSTIGAGDAFASGVFVEYTKRRTALAAEDQTQFSDADLEAITAKGQQMGRLCVTHKGAQVPPLSIAAEIHGDVPTVGTLVENGLGKSEQRGIA